MIKKVSLKGRSISKGITEGKAVVTQQPLGFYGGIEKKSGEITQNDHELKGQIVSKKILVMPYHKGSSAGGIWLLDLLQLGGAPAAIVMRQIEPILAYGAYIAEEFFDKIIPIVDKLDSDPCQVIQTGDYVRVDGNKGIVEVHKTQGRRVHAKKG